jgi:hypothetical protein
MKRSRDDSVRDLLEGLPPADGGDFAVRRLRQRVLDSVSAAQEKRPSPSPRMVRRIALGVTFFVASGAIALLWSPRRHPPTGFLASVQSIDGGPILWARNLENGIEWLTLRDGAFRVSIHAHGPDRRVVVRVPEGRIDDLGTIFDVRIQGERTISVRVLSGHLQLWFGGASGVVLGTSETWEAPPSPSAVPHPTTAIAPGTRVEPQSAVTPQKVTSSEKDHDAFPHRHAVRKPTNNGRSEDAAYLKVVDLLRLGQRDEARTVARDYVRRFPGGFRRTEMEAIAK